MIHVGVSHLAKQLTVESQAHRKGYQRMDYLDRCPANHTCTADGAIRLHTRLNVERICNEFNNCSEIVDNMKAEPSKDAGRLVLGTLALYHSRIFVLVDVSSKLSILIFSRRSKQRVQSNLLRKVLDN